MQSAQRKFLAHCRQWLRRRANEARMGLRRCAREGKVRLGTPNRPEVYARRKPLLTGDELQKLLSETRGDA